MLIKSFVGIIKDFMVAVLIDCCLTSNKQYYSCIYDKNKLTRN
jgi:hypothetical protein